VEPATVTVRLKKKSPAEKPVEKESEAGALSRKKGEKG
jgi:hypothetical protein